MIVDQNLPQKIETKLGGEYNVESVINDDGTQTLNITSAEIFENKLPQVIDDTSVEITEKDLDGATTIRTYAFAYSTGLTYITIPSSVISIENNAFYNCSNLINVTIKNGVTNVGNNAFQGCSSLTNITIPDSVTSVGSNAFYKCDALQTTTYNNGKYLLSNEGKYTLLFSVASKTGSSFELPEECKIIYYNAFNGYTTLRNIDFRNVTNIGNQAFYNCRGLTSLIIPDSITNIGQSVFYGCSGITNVVIGKGLTKISATMFSGCTKLNNISIPDNITSIDTNGFYNCTSLTNIELPDTITTIGDNVFLKCTNLTTMTIKATTPPSLANTNAISTATTTIYIPKGTIDVYKAATNWSSFASKFVEKEM